MQNIEKERYSWLKLSIILLLIVLVGMATALSSAENIPLNMDDQAAINVLKIAQTLAAIVIFIVPAVLFAVLATRRGFRYLGLHINPGFKTLAIAGLGMILALPLINGLLQLNQQLKLPASMHSIEVWMQQSEETAKKITEAFLQGTDVNTLFVNLFVVAFMAALSEELFFRGVLQKVLMECFKNKHLSVWIGAILFSAFHMQFFGFLPRMLMGAYLGYLFLWTGSLWPGIVAHFLNNGIAVYGNWLVNKGTIDADAENIGMDSQQWVYVVISTIMVVTSLLLIYRTENKKEEEVTEF